VINRSLLLAAAVIAAYDLTSHEANAPGPCDITYLERPVVPFQNALAAAGAVLGVQSLVDLIAAAESAEGVLPTTLARAIPADIPTTTLGPVGTPEAIAGLDSTAIAQRLTLRESPSGFRIIEFPTPARLLKARTAPFDIYAICVYLEYQLGV
jgi:hypothetical protein